MNAKNKDNWQLRMQQAALELAECRKNRAARARDLSTREDLGLKQTGIVYTAAGESIRLEPRLLYQDQAGEEWLRWGLNDYRLRTPKEVTSVG